MHLTAGPNSALKFSTLLLLLLLLIVVREADLAPDRNTERFSVTAALLSLFITSSQFAPINRKTEKKTQEGTNSGAFPRMEVITLLTLKRTFLLAAVLF